MINADEFVCLLRTLGYSCSQHSCNSFIGKLSKLCNGIEPIIQCLIKLLGAVISDVHCCKESEILMTLYHFSVIKTDKSIIIKKRIQKCEMLGTGKIYLLKNNSTAVSDSLGNIALPENYLVTVRQELAENEFIKALGAVDSFHYGKSRFTTNELT